MMEILPVALSIGMTYEEFWNSTPKILFVYIDAHNRKIEEIDKLNWYHGMYVRDAIASCFDNKHRYMSEPLLHGMAEDSRLTEEEREIRDMNRQIASMMMWAEKEKENGLKEAYEDE